MLARLAKEEFVKCFERELPSATACFLDDFEACNRASASAHRASPGDSHHQFARELFGEERRRTKVIPHAFGERPVLKLMYAALIRASPT
jgi:putative transposase